ncbi:hypothetical protein FO519_001303, partial [Halicephalobus sp. NKZ332]
MVLWSSPRAASTPLRRSSIHYKPLTREEARQILASPVRTGYTYAQSASYNSSYPTEYIHPNFVGSWEDSGSIASNDGSIVSSVYSGTRTTIITILQTILTILSWIWTVIKYPILYFTPVAPIYIAYNKGQDLAGWASIVVQFFRRVFVIGYECIKDMILTTGYVSNNLRKDLVSVFWSVLGYDYNEEEQVQHQRNLEAPRNGQDGQESTYVKRLIDSAIYILTLGYFPSHMAGAGVAPPLRSHHRTRQTKKSWIMATILSILGMAYYVVSGQFLFQNLQGTGPPGVVTRRREQELAEERKKWSWLWWLLALLLLFGLFYYGFGRKTGDPKRRFVTGAKAEDNYSVSQMVYDGAEYVYTGTSKVVSESGSAVGNGLRWLYTKVVGIIFGIPEFISHPIKVAKKASYSSVEATRDVGSGFFKSLGYIIYYALEGVYNVLSVGISGLCSLITGTGKAVGNFFYYIFDGISNLLKTGTHGFTSISSGILKSGSSSGYTLISWIGSFISDVFSFIGAILWKPVTLITELAQFIGKTAYNAALYYLISQLIYALLFVWYSILYLLRGILSLPFLIYGNLPSLPKPLPVVEKSHTLPSDDELNARIRQLIQLVLSEKKKEWRSEFVGIVEEELQKTKSENDVDPLQNFAELESFKRKIEVMLQDKFSNLGSAIRQEVMNEFTKKDKDEKLQKVIELHNEVDHLKAELAAQTGLGVKLRKELSDAINKLTESQDQRYREYGTRLENLDSISNTDVYDSKFSQWEKDLDSVKKEMRSIAAVAQESQDVKTAAATDSTMRRLESVINTMFEKERETIRLEKEQINKWIKEREAGMKKQQLSPEEVNQMVQNAVGKINISAVIQDIVKAHLESNKNTHVDEQFINNHLHILILEVLKKFSYDKTGEPDFALESAGGFVVSTRCTENYDEKSRRESIFGIPLWFTSYSPRSVIQRKSQNLNAGECWAIKGSQSYLVIQLARKIDVTAVSYEHLPKELSISGNIDSAPKDFKIWSLETENDPNKFLIGEYT